MTPSATSGKVVVSGEYVADTPLDHHLQNEVGEVLNGLTNFNPMYLTCKNLEEGLRDCLSYQDPELKYLLVMIIVSNGRVDNKQQVNDLLNAIQPGTFIVVGVTGQPDDYAYLGYLDFEHPKGGQIVVAFSVDKPIWQTAKHAFELHMQRVGC